jgi:hypothetical protein
MLPQVHAKTDIEHRPPLFSEPSRNLFLRRKRDLKERRRCSGALVRYGVLLKTTRMGWIWRNCSKSSEARVKGWTPSSSVGELSLRFRLERSPPPIPMDFPDSCRSDRNRPRTPSWLPHHFLAYRRRIGLCKLSFEGCITGLLRFYFFNCSWFCFALYCSVSCVLCSGCLKSR